MTSCCVLSGVLDTTEVPKELIVLEGTNGLTVIELVLRALYRAGIERVYLILGKPHCAFVVIGVELHFHAQMAAA